MWIIVFPMENTELTAPSFDNLMTSFPMFSLFDKITQFLQFVLLIRKECK
jgi:hypothetical protein